ncbi:MAG: methyltransferase domain-containing protein [Gammaproteobacteria bacterium]|nr:methyltransferase domain-containing protein [Gammaproteobacteria bacterium]
MSNTTACLNMIKQQLRTNNIRSESILSLFTQGQREAFVPEAYKAFTYSDMQINLNHGQVMLTPLEEAQILETAALQPNDFVLEIGTGSGHLTYLLSQQCQKVVSIDIHDDFIQQAKAIFKEKDIHNAEFLNINANDLSSITCLFDAVICTAAVEEIPVEWLKVMKANGKIFVPVGKITQNAQWLFLDNKKISGHEFVFHTHVPSLIQNQKKEKFIF